MTDNQNLPPIADRRTIQDRLRLVFPEGTPNRGYCVREMAASAVFAMLYVGAIEGTGRFLAPKQVYRMTENQARRTDNGHRLRYAEESLKPGFAPKGQRWYADNTREPIRDETLRDGLVSVGAVSIRPGVPTTSGRPRYALKASFAALFALGKSDRAFADAAAAWRRDNLSPGALARVALMAQGAASTREGVLVTFRPSWRYSQSAFFRTPPSSC